MAEDAPARVDPLAYLAARARQVRRMCSTETSTITTTTSGSILQELLFQKLSRHAAMLLQTQEVHFFNEHYVVKPPRSSVEFRWHRDDDEQLAMCVHRTQIAPYLSAWCALDDVTLANGPLRFVPVHAVRDDQDPDREQLELLATEPLCVQAGTVVLFLSHVWHCSSSNDSCATRRAFYAQFSRERITATPKDTAPLSFAIPCYHQWRL